MRKASVVMAIQRKDEGARESPRVSTMIPVDVELAQALALRWEAGVERAAGGMAGLIALAERNPNLVIADSVLPDVSSGELPACLSPPPICRSGSMIPQPPADVSLQHLEIVRWVLEFIERRFREGTPLATIARGVGVSRSHLCRIFRRVTGQSVKSYLTRRRLQAARAMLRNPQMMIQEVAAAVGYRELSHFDRVFRRLEGQSPSSYRRRCVQGTRLSTSHQNHLANPYRNVSSPV